MIKKKGATTGFILDVVIELDIVRDIVVKLLKLKDMSQQFLMK